MLSSIFVRFKTGLSYTAILSALIMSGCTLTGQQEQPLTPAAKAEMEMKQFQKVIDDAQGLASLDVIRAYIGLETLITDPQLHQKNIDDTWLTLTKLTPEQRRGIVIKANENTLQGWLDLLNTYEYNKDDADKLSIAVREWQTRYPRNPAALTLPASLLRLSQPSVSASSQIALLLPLTGQAKVFGEAIRQGFLDAQSGLPQPQAMPEPQAPKNDDSLASILEELGISNTETPATDPDTAKDTAENSETNQVKEEKETETFSGNMTVQLDPIAQNSRQVIVYDTNSQSIDVLLKKVQQDGANLIVGPLLKPEVMKTIELQSGLPVLALNELDNVPSATTVCFFSLSPEDETRNAAQHLRQQQKSNPLIIVPDNKFGQRMAQTFADEWQRTGGGTVLQQTFSSVESLKASINRGVGIRMTGTPILPTANAPLPLETQSIPSTGGAIDSVYIIATSDELTLIKPMIDMAISTQKRPPIYVSSRSNQGGTGPDFRMEMDGIQFSDIPLMTGANLPLMQKASSKFANDYSLMRLYAMGIDAWSLANNYNDLTKGTLRFNGISGSLRVENNCTVYRELPWMQFKQGKIEPVAQ
ncbi:MULTISPECIES: penicillin-binding protein activator [Enterobacterales]|uniref:penicillin-binding protein activator n=1 Tax=Enterobacterales TaxID=91347 RepID=UPI000847FDEA|nr:MULTISPECIES: penicillin-binding protein activator [Enterobacterales]WOO50395.1 penicillin-binding protein activator [Hafnia alvei]MCK9782502.1 penicillin-binding protein activator [Proteus columbae]ODQ06251.1 penicillin-binding protein activator LpoA [Shigella sp. FC130]OEI93764.1 penicillin-binding protein activator LpoA [Shigella sp. FC1655]OEJ07734.1 penicillin-binding protein activator LpoA [Shigella sp. FC1967]